MSMQFTSITHNVSESFVCAIVNNDFSGCTDEEVSQLRDWFKSSTEPYRDADDNEWVYTHTTVDTAESPSFARCDVCDLYADTYPVQVMFTLRTPQLPL